jgi:hypothetical protein
MRGPRAVSYLALGAGVLIAMAGMRWFAAEDPFPAALDPAVAFHTQSHTSGYGGIDRWAHHGMRAEAVVATLQKDGYECVLPKADGDGLRGVHELRCDKQVSGLFARTLSVRASIDYDMRGRLVAAGAGSGLTGVRAAVGGFLAKAGLIEPVALRVRGFEIDSADMLARRAVDALNPKGWAQQCRDPVDALACAQGARQRREHGFPALPQGAAPTGEAMRIPSAMESIGLVSPVQRGADGLREDTLMVRVADGEMWLDFRGRNLAGAELSVSIALASEGGTPTRLMATLGAQHKEVALAGTSRSANGGAPVWLAPSAAAGNPRAAAWVDMPQRGYPGTYSRLAEVLPATDPAFVAPIVKAVVTAISAHAPPDEALGLYPPLRSIEFRADSLRLAQADRWLGAGASRMMRQAYPEQPVVRAAFALATCEAGGALPFIRPGCWTRFAADDPDAAALIRREAEQLEMFYSGLEPDHPLRRRLKRLTDQGKQANG